MGTHPWRAPRNNWMCHQCSELCDKVEISHRLDSKISEISSNLNDSVTL